MIMMTLTKLANNMVANLEARNINQLQVQQVHPDHEIFIPWVTPWGRQMKDPGNKADMPTNA